MKKSAFCELFFQIENKLHSFSYLDRKIQDVVNFVCMIIYMKSVRCRSLPIGWV